MTSAGFEARRPLPRSRAWPVNTNKGLLLLRLVVGLLFAGHACQKLWGWFGGTGMGPFIQSLEKLGLQPAPFWGHVEAYTELLGGTLLVLGLLTPFAAAALIGDMLVAAAKVHAPKGLWSQQGGFEYNAVLIAILLAIGLIGPGIYSLDGRLPVRFPKPLTFFVALAATLAVVAAALLGRPPK